MRIKERIRAQYRSVLQFWCDVCKYRGESVCYGGRCCNPETAKYQKKCEKLWRDWHKAGSKGKLPVMPSPTVECEKCQYADLTVGSFQGHASSMTICRHTDGVIPVPVKGRKKIWLDNINQKQLETLLDDMDSDIEAFAISGSPKITDFTFLERFKKLKYVYLWWNNQATSLWDMTKTPDVEFLYLESMNKLSDVTQVQNAKKLRYFFLHGGAVNIESLKPFENHPSLEYIALHHMLADTDLSSVITVPNLKYFECHFNLFDMDAYAEFEAKRPDVDTNFWEGIEGYEYDEPHKPYWVYLVGKRKGSADPDDYVKQEKHKKKYQAAKEKFLTRVE